MITNIDAAEDAFNAAVSDAEADLNVDNIEGDGPHEVEWHDIVVSVCWDLDDATARELCRTKLGHIPHELESRLGQFDWIDQPW